jgi:hypothetical protein
MNKPSKKREVFSDLNIKEEMRRLNAALQRLGLARVYRMTSFGKRKKRAWK